jgi:hypothetical protein
MASTASTFIALQGAKMGQEWYRHPREMLWTGPALDKFRTRPCRNVQFKGELMQAIDVNDVESGAGPMWLGDVVSHMVFSLPGMVYAPIGTGYKRTRCYIANEGTAQWAAERGYSSSYASYLYCHSVFTATVDGKTRVGNLEVCFALNKNRELRYNSTSGFLYGDYGEAQASLRTALKSLSWPRGQFIRGQLAQASPAIFAVINQYLPAFEHALVQYTASQPAPVSPTSRYSVTVNGVSPTEERRDQLQRWLDTVADIYAGPDWSAYELSRHAREVIEGINDFDSNALAYAKDLSSVGDTVRSLLRLGVDYDNPKAWASAWLSLRYGDRLQIADTAEALESLKRALLYRQYWTKVRRKMERHYEHSTYSERYWRASTIYVANESYDSLTTSIENLMRWDAWPTLENTWDLVPLSFLVDWVVPVSDLLSQIDAAVEAPYIKPLSEYVGEYGEIAMPISSFGFSGTVRYCVYRRYAHSILSDIRPFDWSPSLPSFSVVHLGDALALVLQAYKA